MMCTRERFCFVFFVNCLSLGFARFLVYPCSVSKFTMDRLRENIIHGNQVAGHLNIAWRVAFTAVAVRVTNLGKSSVSVLVCISNC